MDSLKHIFAPRTVAVIGASRREGSLGKMFMDAIVQMKPKSQIYPINPKAETINNIPCLAKIDNLPETPDLAVILLGKEMVLDTVKELARWHVKNIVVISAGFKETGEDGTQREQELLSFIKKNNMRMIGPNSMGLFNTDPHVLLNATFSPTPIIPGHIAFISQSGALGVAVFELSQKMNLGFSFFVSTGNKADIGDVDCLRFLSENDNTQVIILYQETIDDPYHFRKICNTLVQKKPVLSLKAGRTESGLKAASSHTGALASDDRITDAFLKQCGIIRCETLNELLNSANAIVSQPIPKGTKTAVISNAGGPGILASDALEKNGLTLSTLSLETIQRLRQILPAEAGVQNPVDMIASATHQSYQAVCEIIEKDEDVDIILIIIVKPPVNTTPKAIINALKTIITGSSKPFFCIVMAREDHDSGLADFKELAVPVFAYPEAAASAISNMIRYRNIKVRMGEYRITDTKYSPPVNRENSKKRQLPFNDICRILEQYDIKVPNYIITSDKQKIVEFASKEECIAIKIANEEIIHKSDLGFVELNLTTSAEITAAYERMISVASQLLRHNIPPLFVAQKMVSAGVELVLGTKKDPLFGSVIMFGIGGILVELYHDVVFRVLPINATDVHEMIDELKGKRIFEGFRNFPVVDRERLAQTIVNFANLIEAHPEIIEMDINPLIWPVDQPLPVAVDTRCTVGLE